jgi:exosortase/archaeosortase family protein
VSADSPNHAASADGRSISMWRLLLTVAAWVVGLFGLMRLGWVQQQILLPLGAFQQRIASDLLGAPRDAVVVNVSCTGADEMALCVGVIAAFPVAWPARVRGALAGLALILALNTVRIGSLSFVAHDGALLNLLHLYVWPAILIVAVLAYVFLWMNRVTRAGSTGAGPTPGPAGGGPSAALAWRFLALSLIFVAAYFGVAPWLYGSQALSAVAGGVATTGAFLIAGLGVPATASGTFLTTAHGGFVVTQECIATPLIPVYLAGVLSAPVPAGRRALALVLAPVLFFGLGTARLLVLALPQALVASHVVAIHAFSQVVAAIVVVGVASWVYGRSAPSRHWARIAFLAVAGAAIVGFGLGPLWTVGIGFAATALQGLGNHAGHAYADPQSAVAMLPAFQMALFVAFWFAASKGWVWRTLAVGLAGLLLSQVALVVLLGELGQHIGFAPHVSLIRGWALGIPIVLMVLLERPPGRPVSSLAVETALPQPG